MALDHIQFDQNSQHGRLLRIALSNLELGFEGLGDIIGAMIHLVDGDGSLDAHYDAMAALIGIPSLTAPDGAVAHLAFNELNSLYSKLNTDSAVTSVRAAMLQAFDKFR